MEIDLSTQKLVNRTYRTYMLHGRQLLPHVPVEATLDDLSAIAIWPQLRKGQFFLATDDADKGIDLTKVPIQMITALQVEAQPE